MSLLDTLKSKAADLWGGGAILNRASPIYDPARNTIVVAGLTLDGVVQAVLSERVFTRSEFGIDPSYYTYYDTNEIRTLTVELLPTAKCVTLMNSLAIAQRQKGGWFTIEIADNGVATNNLRGHIISANGYTQSEDAPNKQVVFGVVPLQIMPIERNAAETQEESVEEPVPTTEIPTADETTPVQWEKGMP